MTSTQSKLKNNSRFLQNFLLSVKSSRKILIFTSVLNLLGFPMIALLLVLENTEFYDKHYDTAYALELISVFCLGVAVVCGIFIAVNNFSYLYKKSEVDMVYSLPIKRRTKFLSDYLSGAAVYLVPYVISSVIADIIWGLGVNFIPSVRLIMTNDDKIMPFVLQIEFAGLLCMLMLYTLSILVMCCCGTLFESLMNILLVNAVIPGSITVASLLFFTGLYGVPVFDTVESALGYSSPVGAFICFVSSISYDQNIPSINAVAYGKWVLLFLLFTAAYFLISMFLYQKRKAEDTSKPYVFKFLYYIFMTVIAMAVSTLAKIEDDMLIPVILFSFIVYMIFEVITNRGFKKFYLSLIKYAATMLGILAVSCLASATHGFGAEGRTYSPSLISSVEIDYEGIDNYLNYTEDYSGGYQTWRDMQFDLQDAVLYKDKGIIQTALNVQKQALDTYKEGKYDYNNNSYISLFGDEVISQNTDGDITDFPIYKIGFKFNLKTGGSITRFYTLNFEQLKQLSILDSTEELADKKAHSILNISPEYYDLPNSKRFILTYSRLICAYDDLHEIYITEDEAEEFAECYKQDYMETPYDEFTSSKIVCYIDNNIPIRECFKRTIGFIKKQGGLDPSEKQYYISDTEPGRLYQPKGYKSWGRDDITAAFGMVKTLNGYSHQLDAAQTSELLKYAQSHYIEDADCYVLLVMNHYYVIPYVYTDIAEKIYKEGQKNTSEYTFDDLVNDMNTSESADDYMYQHMYDIFSKGNYTFYDELSYIYDLVNSGQRTDNDAKNYELLSEFFGCCSYEDYIEKTRYENTTTLNEWKKYTETFPQISDENLGFLNCVN